MKDNNVSTTSEFDRELAEAILIHDFKYSDGSPNEKEVESVVYLIKQAIDTHIIPKKSLKAQRAYRIDSNDYVLVVKEKAANKVIDKARKALWDGKDRQDEVVI